MASNYSEKRHWHIPLIILLLVFISGCVQQESPWPNYKPNAPVISTSIASAYMPTGNGWAKVHDGLWAGNVELTSDGGAIVFGTSMNDAIKHPYGLVMPARYLFRIDANGSIVWRNTFMYARDSPTGAVSQTSDGGYIIADAVYKRESGNVVLRGEIQKKSDDKMTDADVLLRKIASDGSIAWNKTFDVSGKDTDDGAWLVAQASDGGYIIVGVIEGSGGYNLANGDTFLLKTDMEGNALWTKAFELEENRFNHPLLLQQTQDKGFIIFGKMYSTKDDATHDERYSYLIKTDSNGNKQWEKMFKMDEIGIASRPLIEQTPDKGFLVVGAVSTQINVGTVDERSSTRAYGLKLDENGNTIEKKWYAELDEGFGDCSGNLIGSIQKASDGGYIIAKEGACLIKLDAGGNKTWERYMTDKDSEILEPKAFQIDGGYILLGNLNYGYRRGGGGYGSGNLGVGWTAVVVIKLDENGYLNQTIYPKPVQRLSPPAMKTTGKGWMKTFGGNFNGMVASVRQTSDGGYIASGYMDPGLKAPSGINDTIFLYNEAAYLLKIDKEGNQVWDKWFGGLPMSACSGYNNIICTLNKNNPSGWLTRTAGRSVQQTSDGGYVIVGDYHTAKVTNDPERFQYDKGDEVYIVKTDMDGNAEWKKMYGEYYQEYGYDVQETSDKGFFIVGSTSSYGVCPWCADELGQSAPEDIYLLKTDREGNIVWKKVIGGMHSDIAFSGQETSDGGFIVAGVSASFSGNGVEDVYLLKIDKDGNKMWEKTFGKKSRTEKGSSVQQTSDGGYIIVGQTVWSVAQWVTESDVYLIKTDANGNKVWEKEFGGDFTDIGYSVEQISDGGYIISGFTDSFEGISGTYLIKTDANGNKIWERIFKGTSGLAIENAVHQTIDGGYIIAAGYKDTENVRPGSPSSGSGQDAYIIKTDENGDV